MKFEDAYRRTNDAVHVREDLLAEMKYKQAKEQAEAPKKRGLRPWMVAVPTAAAATALACLAVVIGLRAGKTASAAKAAEQPAYEQFDAEVPEEKMTEPVANGFAAEDAAVAAGDSGLSGLFTVDSYEALAEQMNLRNSSIRYCGATKSEASMPSEADMPTDAMPEPVEEPSMVVTEQAYAADGLRTDVNGRSEYGTNVQVANVDEADIVKTDGKWIYCLNRTNNRLYVVEANGKKTKITASAELRSNDAVEAGRIAAGTGGGWIDYQEMILSNDKLFVIGTVYCWSDKGRDTQTAFTEIYELGDRSELKRVDTLEQEGSYRTARLIGNTLVLVSDYRDYWYTAYDGVKYEDWCPRIWTSGSEEPLVPGDIYVNGDSKENGFTVITTIDTEKETQFDSHKAVLGGCSVVYCNETNLLIASGEWEHSQSEEQTDASGKHFVKDVSHDYTSLCLFTIEGGTIEPVATQKIEGSLLNQFSMDASNNTYRLVVTRDGYEQTIWTDGIDTYEFKELRNCALYVLDADLKQIGILENLAEDEMVQSVRFMGDTAYFVTFRQVDPLFAVDLSDPVNPTVLSKLKIPGFSAYLHPFGEGRLIGIGYDADEKIGRTEGVKLSLFDISDPSNVKEIAKKSVDASYVTVQYNHKAVFADVESGVIAFPADNSYFVFRVSDKGFKEVGRIEIEEMGWDGDVRGVSIDKAFYVVSADRVTVLSFEKMKKIADVKFK